MNKIRQFLTDNYGNTKVGQAPNIPLTLWAITFVLSHVLQRGHTAIVLSTLSTIFLSIWAYEEITRGESPFRKTVGVIIALAVLYGIVV